MANFFPDTLLLVKQHTYTVFHKSCSLFCFFVKIFAIMPSIPRQHSLVVWEMASQWEWTGHLHAYTDNFAYLLQTRERLQSIWKKTELFWNTLYIQQPLSHLKANQSIQQHSIISYSCHSPQGDYSVTHVHIKYMYIVQRVQILGFIGLHTYILTYAHL